MISNEQMEKLWWQYKNEGVEPEKIRETLFRALDKLDDLYEDCNCYEQQLRKEREAHNQVVDNLNAELAAIDRKLAEKETRIAAMEK